MFFRYECQDCRTGPSTLYRPRFFSKTCRPNPFGTDLVHHRDYDCISFSQPQTNISSILHASRKSLELLRPALPDDVLRKFIGKRPRLSPASLMRDCRLCAGRRTCAARHSLIACSAWSNCCGVSDFRTSCAASALCLPRFLPEQPLVPDTRSFMLWSRPATFRDCYCASRRHNSPPLIVFRCPRA